MVAEDTFYIYNLTVFYTHTVKLRNTHVCSQFIDVGAQICVNNFNYIVKDLVHNIVGLEDSALKINDLYIELSPPQEEVILNGSYILPGPCFSNSFVFVF